MCLGPELLAGLGAATGGLSASSIIGPLIGIGTSLIGGQMQASAQRQQQQQQLNQNLAAEQARNQVLQKFLATQKQYQADNQNQISTNITADSQPKLAAEQSSDAANRIQNADSTVQGVITPNIAPPSATGSSAAQNDLNARSNTGLGIAKAGTDAGATLGAYGDANAYMRNAGIAAGRQVNTTNAFAQGDAALLPSEQQFADFGARVGNPVEPVSTWGQGIQGIGNAFASLAGSGKFKNVFG